VNTLAILQNPKSGKEEKTPTFAKYNWR